MSLATNQKVDYKKFGSAVFVLAIITLSFAFLSPTLNPNARVVDLGDNVRLTITIDEEVVYSGVGHNTITDNGLDFIMVGSFYSPDSSTPKKAMYLCFGNSGTPTTSSASTVGEITDSGLDKHIADYEHISNACLNLSYTFTATASVTGISYVYLCYTATESATGDLVAFYQISPTINLGIGSQVTVEWQFTGERSA